MRLNLVAAWRELLGVSDDTFRRWAEMGTLPVERDASNRRVIDGVALATFARAHSRAAPDPSAVWTSARNRLVGLITSVVANQVMAQVEIQCGPHRVVSLMSSEAVRDLGLEPGGLVVAVIKSTNVVLETPNPPAGRRGPERQRQRRLDRTQPARIKRSQLRSCGSRYDSTAVSISGR